MAGPLGTVAIAGAGQAGLQAAVSLRDEGFEHDIVLLGDEPGLPYQRPPLSKAYLGGQMEAAGLLLRQQAFLHQHRIDYRPGYSVTAIDRVRRHLALTGGGVVAFDHLVLATGARNRLLPVPGADLDGVYGLRTLADADRLRQAFASSRRAVVVGAGFIGLEFAAIAAKAGLSVTVFDVADRPMSRAVTPETSNCFEAAHREAGVFFRWRTSLTRIRGENGRVSGVEASDGSTVVADLVLVGIGVVPNVELAAEAGLDVDNGIVVDAHLMTSDPAVSAIGDCAAYPSLHAGCRTRLESVQNAIDHARVLAAGLMGHSVPYGRVPWFWSDQGSLKLQIAGLTAGYDQQMVRGNPAERRFSVLCFRSGRLIGIESINRPADHAAGRRLLAGSGLTPEQAADPAFDLRRELHA